MFSDGHMQQTALARLRQVIEEGGDETDLARLANSEEALVRAAVAEHPLTSILALLRLAEDEAISVRAAVARNRREDIPEDLHERLASDAHVEVRMALASNPTIPQRVLDRLARSRDKDVAQIARRRVAEQGGAKGMLARMALPLR
ncbi:hypothetical protein [Demequina sp. NBRC 110054]|uniref:hypothetical protein n=1 Tax=Demequina sp. NBRC 110054 TaxID=1570343 RepID=UPI000A018840|nr:hypothetical protein [Demequina sp. NBRC 110054]